MGTSWQEVKMRIVFALLSLTALGHSKVLRDPAVDEYIAAILELLKTQMPTGIPDLGIPPLDPFEVPHFDIDPIDIDDPVPVKLNITIDDFVIKNLATFETQHIPWTGLHSASSPSMEMAPCTLSSMVSPFMLKPLSWSTLMALLRSQRWTLPRTSPTSPSTSTT